MDLTRGVSMKPDNKESQRKLTFSVENILDPNKFTGKQSKYGMSMHWNGAYDRDELNERMDEENSESHSGKNQ